MDGVPAIVYRELDVIHFADIGGIKLKLEPLVSSYRSPKPSADMCGADIV